ncbi:hypothetical protein B0T17DRAFT_534874 [Bombardia bombarda]|uniref:Uncharacterized protein n=1 Tax=Bombardia bombarda TaxID=252184 RepID=A0AA40C293_9PEZI|nr:hypothetical protein B0T17DRAFT_534874 [Bombardia bombarda]
MRASQQCRQYDTLVLLLVALLAHLASSLHLLLTLTLFLQFNVSTDTTQLRCPASCVLRPVLSYTCVLHSNEAPLGTLSVTLVALLSSWGDATKPNAFCIVCTYVFAPHTLHCVS